MANQKEYSSELLAYKGPVSIDVVVFFSSYIRKKVMDSTQLASKLYKIFVELTQNIGYYSFEKQENEYGESDGIGKFWLSESDDYYTVSSMNVVTKEDGEVLDANCKSINELSRDGVRELKRKSRVLSSIKNNGAHVGLMHMRLVSDNLIGYAIEPIDDKTSLFSITLKVNKN